MMILYTSQTERFAKNILEHFTQYLEGRYRDEFPENNTGLIKLRTHWSNETEPKIIPTVRKRDVYVFHAFCGRDDISYDPDVGWMRLYMIDDALRRMSPSEISYIMPHMPYQRQDYTEEPHVSISAVRTLKMLLAQTFNVPTRIVTFDTHSKQYQAFFDGFFDPLKAMPFHEKYVRENGLIEDAVVVSADAGAFNNAQKFSKKIGVPFTAGNKIRPKASEVEVFEIVGKEEVKGRRALVYEDLIDTFSTGGAITIALRDSGAEDVYILATHGIFSTTDKGPPEKRIRESGTKIVITNSIPYRNGYAKENKDWLTILDIEPMIAEFLYRAQRGDPVSPLYEQAYKEEKDSKVSNIT